MLAAALTVTIMTYLRLPVSTSQAVIGSIMGGGLLLGKTDFSYSVKFLSAWVVTPLGALIISFIIYKLIESLVEPRINNLVVYDIIIKIGFFYAAGIFAAYSLGANNVANVTSIYAGQLNLITTQQAVLIGGISIAIGVLTFSKRVMFTVGKGLVPLSPMSGFVSVLAAAITVYIYARIGIPVSTSQAIVGAVIGIGLVKGAKSVNSKTLLNILFAWFGTPTVAGIVSFLFSIIIKYFFLIKWAVSLKDAAIIIFNRLFFIRILCLFYRNKSLAICSKSILLLSFTLAIHVSFILFAPP